MHFDRQILYLACLFGIQSASGLAIPDGSHALEKLASLSSSDSSRSAHHTTKAQESIVSETAILKSPVPTKSQLGRLFPSADPRIIDSASRATLPRVSYDPAPNSISTSRSFDLTSTSSDASFVTSPFTSSPTRILDDRTNVGHQNELRQVSASSTSASMSSAAASSAVASGAVVQGSACSASSGTLICSSDGTQFGYCVDGSMVWRPVAPGTECSNGAIAFSISPAASASTTASGSSISVATISGSSTILTTSQSVSATTQSSSLSSLSQSSSGTTALGGGTTRTNTGTNTQSTTTRSGATSNTRSTTTGTQTTSSGKQTSNTSTRTSNTRTRSTDTGTSNPHTGSQTTNTGTQSRPTGMPTGPMHPTTSTWTSTHSIPTGPHSSTSNMHHTTTSATLTPTSAGGNNTAPGSDPTHPLTNASVAGIASGLTAGAVMVALGGLYAWRRKKQGKPLFGARGSKRSTGSFYPKSAWLYDPPVSPNHSRAGSDAGQNLIPPPRPETSEMEAGMASPDLRPVGGAASPDLRAARASSPLLPPPIMITRDESPDGSPGDSPRRSGGRRSRPMMSINEEEE